MCLVCIQIYNMMVYTLWPFNFLTNFVIKYNYNYFSFDNDISQEQVWALCTPNYAYSYMGFFEMKFILSPEKKKTGIFPNYLNITYSLMTSFVSFNVIQRNPTTFIKMLKRILKTTSSSHVSSAKRKLIFLKCGW